MHKSSLVPALVALTLALLLALTSARGADRDNAATITGAGMTAAVEFSDAQQEKRNREWVRRL